MLKERLRPDALAAEHPLRALWELQGAGPDASEARFEFHHLASDLRLVEGVPGAQSLVKGMLADAAAYGDYRYELRIAGSAARSPNQKLVRLGAKNKGADVEVQTRSGHLCGIACYRANPVTPHLQAATRVSEDLVTHLAISIGTAPVEADVAIEIEFERFPIEESSKEAAIEAFASLWADHDGPPVRVVADKVRVSRTGVDIHPGKSGEVRVTVRLPVPAREKRRIVNNVEEKLRREASAWANDYAGVPVFAIEESDFALGIEKQVLEPLLAAGASHRFSCVLTTWPFFADHSTRGRYLVEDVNWVSRGDVMGLDIGLHTFGQNTVELGKGNILFSTRPNLASEEWLVSPLQLANTPELRGAFNIQLLRGLEITRRITRLPTKDGSRPSLEQLSRVVEVLYPELANRPTSEKEK